MTLRAILLRPALIFACILPGSGSPDVFADQLSEKNEVIVMGMIHSSHRRPGPYDIGHLKDIIRSVEPDFVLTEIPPDRFEAASEQFAASGKITESRVRVFPEYTEALFPLTREMNFEIVPCAAWTKQMNDSRNARLAELRTSHADQYREMSLAQRNISTEVSTLGDRNDPRIIHTTEYDALVKAGMEPYDRFFNDALGDGGWSNINEAHYGLIAKALDAHAGEGKRFLVTFGSWHKYYIKERLQQRDDVTVTSLAQYLPASEQASPEASPSDLLSDFRNHWKESDWEKVFRGSTYMRRTGNPDWKHRMLTLRTLVLGGQKSVPALLDGLRSDHEGTRVLAAQALSFLGPVVEPQKLQPTLASEQSAAVRLYSVDAVGTSGKSASFDWSVLGSERNRDVRKHMTYAKDRGNNAIADSVVETLRNWDPHSMDTAKVGETAPDFELSTIDGAKVRLSDFRGRKPVVLVFIYGDT